MAEVELEAGVGVDLQGDHWHGEGPVDLPALAEHELHHHPCDVDAVVHELQHVVQQRGPDSDQRNPVYEAAQTLLVEHQLFLLEGQVHLPYLVFLDLEVDMQPGQSQVVQVLGYLDPLEL